MKTKNLFGILILFLFTFAFISCDKEDEEGTKVTNYQEYELTVASKKVLGMIFSEGNNYFRKVYAVKKNNAQDWISFSSIQDFNYEEGYEYHIKISETTYLDYREGDLSRTEYKLLDVISKEKHDSEGLPDNFLSSDYNSLNAEFRYVIEADEKDEVEKRLMNNSPLFMCKQFVFNKEFTEFAMLNEDNKYLVLADGKLKIETNDNDNFPDSYKLIPLEGEVAATEQWTFLIDLITHKAGLTMDAFIVNLPGSTGDSGDMRSQIRLYHDMTQYAQEAFPEAGVKAVVVSYTVSIN
jgi:hypothetical protein